MKCPFCGHSNTQVLDTRMSEDGDAVRRRRRCESCDRRFTTYERIELFFPAIVKKNGSRVDYTRAKLKDSMRLALRKRPVSAEAIDEAITRIEERLLSLGEKEIASSQVGGFGDDRVAQARQDRVYPVCVGVPEFRGCFRILRCTRRSDRGQQQALSALPFPDFPLVSQRSQQSCRYAAGLAPTAFSRVPAWSSR